MGHYETRRQRCTQCNGRGKVDHGRDHEGNPVVWDCPTCDGARELDEQVYVEDAQDAGIDRVNDRNSGSTAAVGGTADAGGASSLSPSGTQILEAMKHQDEALPPPVTPQQLDSRLASFVWTLMKDPTYGSQVKVRSDIRTVDEDADAVLSNQRKDPNYYKVFDPVWETAIQAAVKDGIRASPPTTRQQSQIWRHGFEQGPGVDRTLEGLQSTW